MFVTTSKFFAYRQFAPRHIKPQFERTTFEMQTNRIFHSNFQPTFLDSLFFFSKIFIHSFNDSSRSHGGGNNGGSNLENFNTYGLSVKFLEGLGITHGPLHTKVFVANVSIALDQLILTISI
jgi:hypothetical protein